MLCSLSPELYNSFETKSWSQSRDGHLVHDLYMRRIEFRAGGQGRNSRSRDLSSRHDCLSSMSHFTDDETEAQIVIAFWG